MSTERIPALPALDAEYELVRELGRGGTAIVYLARERATGTEVAVKLIRAKYIEDEEALARFAREARFVAQLDHPNIVPMRAVLDLGEAGIALVMGHVEGCTLKQLIQEKGPLSAEKAERILRDVAAALGAAHDMGIIHRDVKPENIFVGADGHALLADFGVARSMSSDTQLTMHGVAIGTPAYMAPEQIDGGQLDGRGDIYSLGLVTWQMLSGNRPWDGESLYAILYHQKHDRLPDVREMRSDVPNRLADVIVGATVKDRTERWQSVHEMIDALDGFAPPRRWEAPVPVSSETIRFERPPTPPRVTPLDSIVAELAAQQLAEEVAPKRRPIAYIGTAVLTVVMLALVGTAMRARSNDALGPMDAPVQGASAGDVGSSGANASAPASSPATSSPAADSSAASSPAGNPPAARPQGANSPAANSPASASSPASAPVARDSVKSRVVAVSPAPAPAATVSKAVAPPVEREAMRLDAREPVKLSPIDNAGRTATASKPPSPAPKSTVTTATPPVTSPPVVAAPPPSVVVPPPPSSRLTIATGGVHTCSIGSDGRLFCWGGNDRGQLGSGAGTTRTSAPLAVGSDLRFTSVSAGLAHSCALARGGAAWCWGENARGQLGDRTDSARATPVRVAEGHAFRAIVTGAASSCGLDVTGLAWCWGSNARGQLGDGSSTDHASPVAVAAPRRFVSIHSGWNFVCALDESGRAMCWGENGAGQLGDGTASDRRTPVAVRGDMSFTAITAGSAHACGLTVNGDAYCWGRNRDGQLGDGTKSDRTSPVRVKGGDHYVAIAAGALHTCAITSTGDAFCWGLNTYGQLGDGTTIDRAEPIAVTGSHAFASLRAFGSHTCGATASGEAFCWGYNLDGQLGDGTRSHRSRPVYVEPPTSK